MGKTVPVLLMLGACASSDAARREDAVDPPAAPAVASAGAPVVADAGAADAVIGRALPLPVRESAVRAADSGGHEPDALLVDAGVAVAAPPAADAAPSAPLAPCTDIPSRRARSSGRRSPRAYVGKTVAELRASHGSPSCGDARVLQWSTDRPCADWFEVVTVWVRAGRVRHAVTQQHYSGKFCPGYQ